MSSKSGEMKYFLLLVKNKKPNEKNCFRLGILLDDIGRFSSRFAAISGWVGSLYVFSIMDEHPAEWRKPLFSKDLLFK